MKKKIILALLILIVLSFAAFMAYASTFPNYNPITGDLNCNAPRVCWHETAHKLDMKGIPGWLIPSLRISSDENFRAAVYNFVGYCEGIEIAQSDIPYCNFMTRYPGVDASLKDFYLPSRTVRDWGGYSEIYSDILSCAGGLVTRMPIQFQEFYDQEKIDEIAVVEYSTGCNIRR